MKSKEPGGNGNPVRGDKLEMLYRGILDHALDCIIIMDANGRVLEFNPAAEHVFGFTRKEAIGKELADLIIPTHLRDQHRRGLAHYLKTGDGPVIGKRIEIGGVRKDGSEVVVELAITAVTINDSPIFVGYLRDITQRRRSEEEREKFIALVEQSDDFIGMGGTDGNVIYINRAGCRMVGLDPAKAPGTPIAAVHPEKWWLKLRDEIFPAIMRGEKNWLGEAQLRNVQTNEPIDVLMNIFSVRHPATSELICYATVMRDISDRTKSEESSRRLAATPEGWPDRNARSSPGPSPAGTQEPNAYSVIPRRRRSTNRLRSSYHRIVITKSSTSSIAFILENGSITWTRYVAAKTARWSMSR